ncbi:MAG TPA: class I SAM-dependent methyltransferase [Steroidobacteraceae bacterium]|nr:class I SAM-dependent methyltransferase [Steroidobacteraceae bacterium]
MALYDRIGKHYTRTRAADPRIATAIERALAGCDTVLNVGAGAGAYEPANRRVIALEPSWTMIVQRHREGAPVVQARAEALPFGDAAFDAVLAVLTVHHWSDRRQGFSECRRVARRRIVFLTIDPAVLQQFWVYHYFPTLLSIDTAIFPQMATFGDVFGVAAVEPLLIPADCLDGFLGAYWRRPEEFLNPSVHAGISTFAQLPASELQAGVRALQQDIESGSWAQAHAQLLRRDALDVGYRLVECCLV